jgi:hypothetical protein
MFKIPAPTFSPLVQSFDGEIYHDDSPNTKPCACSTPPMRRCIRKNRSRLPSRKRRKTSSGWCGLPPKSYVADSQGRRNFAGRAGCRRWDRGRLFQVFTNLLEINQEEHWVRVQPGVIRDDLNAALKPYGLMFGPETSTASRAMVGGMIGNNSCGLHSIVWGSTRHHLLEAKAVLSDGAEVTFKSLSAEEFEQKCRGENVVSPLEQRLYQQIRDVLGDPANRQQIRDGFPNQPLPVEIPATHLMHCYHFLLIGMVLVGICNPDPRCCGLQIPTSGLISAT